MDLEIASSTFDLMEEFELGVILSPARRNGAYSMLKTIKEYEIDYHVSAPRRPNENPSEGQIRELKRR